LDFLAIPAAHLAAGVAGEQRQAAVVLEQRLHRFAAAAEVPPRGLHPGVAAEADRGAEGEGRILAEIVVARRVTELDRAGLYRVEHLQTRDDLASGKGADLELAVGDLADALCNQLRAAEQRVEALAPAGRH